MTRRYANADGTTTQIGDHVHADQGAYLGPSATVIVGRFERDASVHVTRDYFVVGPIGSENRFLTLHRTDTDAGHRVQAGCWSGTLDQLRARIANPGQAWGGRPRADTHLERWHREYELAIALFDARLAEWAAEPTDDARNGAVDSHTEGDTEDGPEPVPRPVSGRTYVWPSDDREQLTWDTASFGPRPQAPPLGIRLQTSSLVAWTVTAPPRHAPGRLEITLFADAVAIGPFPEGTVDAGTARSHRQAIDAATRAIRDHLAPPSVDPMAQTLSDERRAQTLQDIARRRYSGQAGPAAATAPETPNRVDQ